MIIEVNKNNLYLLNNSFIDKKTVIDDLEKNPFGKLIILKENDEIVGFLYYSIIYDRIEINQFEINKIHRNCGKGKKLLEYFLNIVDKDITLEVREDNIPAITLYEKNGFIKKAIRKGYYKGIDGILMERKYKDSH